MAKFRKKPVVINAWKARDILYSAARAWDKLPEEVKQGYDRGDFIFAPDYINVRTLEGTHIVGIDDMLIQGVKGEFYGCKPDIFEATYEQVEENGVLK